MEPSSSAGGKNKGEIESWPPNLTPDMVRFQGHCVVHAGVLGAQEMQSPRLLEHSCLQRSSLLCPCPAHHWCLWELHFNLPENPVLHCAKGGFPLKPNSFHYLLKWRLARNFRSIATFQTWRGRETETAASLCTRVCPRVHKAETLHCYSANDTSAMLLSYSRYVLHPLVIPFQSRSVMSFNFSICTHWSLLSC